MPDVDAAKIRALNDHARQSFTGCRVVVTQGIQALDNVPDLLDQVSWYDAFTPDNDTYGEHDFGAFYWGEAQVFWKWDYYDLDLTMHSPDPSDPTVTLRVLTVMLVEEY